jgi:hypothetical protein
MIKKLSFWCFDQPLVVWQRWENLERIFFELSIIELLRKSKKIKKKSLSFFHAFANLWDSGKSAALKLEPKTFRNRYLLIISFKNHYSQRSNPSFYIIGANKNEHLKA